MPPKRGRWGVRRLRRWIALRLLPSGVCIFKSGRVRGWSAYYGDVFTVSRAIPVSSWKEPHA